MPYGEIRVDTITFTNAGVDKSITVSGLFASTSGNLTVTGTVSGTTFTGTTANFTSGNVTTFSGGTCTITSGVFASGTATNPSISFIADSNTGLYSPGADQFAIATNGAGRLFVNSSGSVGIGTSSPSAPFHVAGSARIGANDTSTVELSIGEGATGDRIALLDFVGDTTYSDYGLRLIRAAGTNATSQLIHRGTGDFAFITNEGSPLIFYTTSSERLRIDSAGKVGIGTSSPISRLHINDGELTISTGGNTSDAGGIINFSIAALPSYSPIATVQGLLVNATGTELQGGLGFFTRPSGAAGQSLHRRMTLSEAGNLGIGVSSPGYRLDITSADTTASVGYAVRLRANATAGAAALQFTDNGATAQYGHIACDSSLNLKFATGTTERLRIDSSGRLLVGTSTAQGDGRIQIQGSNVTGKLTMWRDNAPFGFIDGTAGASVEFGASPSSGVFGIGAAISFAGDGTWGSGDYPGRLVFSTTADGASSPTERMRITNGGSVLVGNGLTQGYGSSSGYMCAIRANSGTQTYFSIALPGQTADNTGLVFGIDTTSANLIVRDNKALVFATSDTNRMTIEGNGSVSIVGSLSKGSGSFRIDHPLPEKADTHQLVHSFIEGPQADLIYRGHVTLQNGTATINIDATARMTEGTFEALCRDVCCFTTNESDWTAVKGSVTGNILTIEAQDPTSTAEVCWMVIGERKDKHMLETDWTDETGRVITEPLKQSALKTT